MRHSKQQKHDQVAREGVLDTGIPVTTNDTKLSKTVGKTNN